MKSKPRCKLIGENGNIFNLMGLARRALIRAGQRDEAAALTRRITDEARSYEEALNIIMEYVEVE